MRTKKQPKSRRGIQRRNRHHRSRFLGQIDHPLLQLPTVLGVNLSVTKHVLMLWLVATVLFLVITTVVRRYLRQEHGSFGPMAAFEILIDFLREEQSSRPNLGKWLNAYALLLTLFFFILGANLIGLIPVFDVLSLLQHTVIHAPEESFFAQVLHGGTTATGNFNVTAALATISFLAIIVAGARTASFSTGRTWCRTVPLPVTIMLIPIEIMGMFVRPFALTMRLAANMTGGRIAILAILSFVFIFAQMNGYLGIGVGLFLSVPLAVGISGLEIIVVLVQAYVFTLLTAVFIGMAIHAHH